MRFLFSTFTLLLALYTYSQPIPVAHAHNDYAHKHPLHNALKQGFTSIEADVYLHNNQLVVSHLPIGLNKKKTLEELYLQPLQVIIEKNKGHVFENDTTPLTLMIDFKTEASATYQRLLEVLKPYSTYITQYVNGNATQNRPLRILISGSTPRQQLNTNDTVQATIDATIEELIQGRTLPQNTSRCSSPWLSFFSWTGAGKMPEKSFRQLKEYCQLAHERNFEIRFYAIPDKPKVWRALLDAGVDRINTDKLSSFRNFYNTYTRH